MENSLENKRVELGQEALGYLDTTRKWTMFFSILGFIVIGLMLVGSLALGSLIGGVTSGLANMEGMEGMEGMDTAKAVGGIAGVTMFIFVLIFGAIYFFPLLFLFRFSKHTKKAVAEQDANELTIGLKNLKSYWKYIGILVIILLAVYVIFFLIFGASMAFLSGLS
jgi:heme/copper-type cytochrome/quinol oxidase subunit 2